MTRAFSGAVEGPRWMATVLKVAAVYNIVWGAAVVAAPGLFFRLAGMPEQSALTLNIWACVGMIVGVYGVGYWAASGDPLRHWPIVLVGLLGKIFGPIGFAKALYDGVFPPVFGLTILTNDLVWWIPFTLMLVAARRRHLAERAAGAGATLVAPAGGAA